ncbi:hypothetical protein PIB30_021134 [Stylosanthes scabra]|uniref:Uncharacterized protein n=1 Tax=Stylosanthes scabra TaxID=79078 RepID=A0ABU6Q8Q5_9FABA|nr:hypothetical protein [Stylosanthes scabra]
MEALIKGLEMSIQFILEESIGTTEEVIFITAEMSFIKWKRGETTHAWRCIFDRNRFNKLMQQWENLTFIWSKEKDFFFVNKWKEGTTMLPDYVVIWNHVHVPMSAFICRAS